MDKYEFLAHTADALMKVRGENLLEIYANAAEGMFALLETKPDKSRPFKGSVIIEGFDAESLLVNWLNELLYVSFSQKAALSGFTILRLSDTGLEASVEGFYAAAGTHPRHEIKAATYHELKITKNKNEYSVQIIFDI